MMSTKYVNQTKNGIIQSINGIVFDAVHFRDFLAMLSIPAHESGIRGEPLKPYIQEVNSLNWAVIDEHGTSCGWTMEEAAKLFVQKCIEYGAKYGSPGAGKDETDEA